MNSELCRAVTNDGLHLDGALFQPESVNPAAQFPIDAFLIIHGTGSNFYAPGVLETFTRLTVAAGYPVLRVNTRGHDGIASIPTDTGSTRGGAAYEHVADCIKDLHAWLDWLQASGRHRIALVGHSMGAVKSLYTMARIPHPAVKFVIGISPPRFNHLHWMNDPDAGPFRSALKTATDLVDAGRDTQLITVRQPIPLTLTAAGFLDKYGPDDNYDYVSLLPRIPCPTLILVGSLSVESSPAFDTLPEELDRVSRECELIKFEQIPGADTMYRDCPHLPIEKTSDWLRTAFPESR